MLPHLCARLLPSPAQADVQSAAGAQVGADLPDQLPVFWSVSHFKDRGAVSDVMAKLDVGSQQRIAVCTAIVIINSVMEAGGAWHS